MTVDGPHHPDSVYCTHRYTYLHSEPGRNIERSLSVIGAVYSDEIGPTNNGADRDLSPTVTQDPRSVGQP